MNNAELVSMVEALAAEHGVEFVMTCPGQIYGRKPTAETCEGGNVWAQVNRHISQKQAVEALRLFRNALAKLISALPADGTVFNVGKPALTGYWHMGTHRTTAVSRSVKWRR